MTMKRRTRSPLALAAVVTAGLITQACSADSTPPGHDLPPIAVDTTTVSMRDITATFEAGGIVQARTTATVTARILAPVRAVRVKAGDSVRAGQVLAVLDGADLGARARGARAAAVAADQGIAAVDADRQAAEAALALARATHTRISTLHARRSATPQELDEAAAALRTAEAQAAGAAARAREAGSSLESARAAADAATTTASFATITSPFAGLVTETLVEPGNMAAPGTPLIRVEDTRGFRLEVRVDESRAWMIARGERVRVLLDAGTETRSVDGTVAEVTRAVDADARAFLVKIELPDSAGVRSGGFGRALFRGAPRRALAVPESAISRRGQVASVFVVDHGVARLRLVNVNGTEVLAGLAAGEQVIVEPPPTVTDGRRVAVGGRP